MFPVFGRHSDTGHPFQLALRGILERSDGYTAEDRAVAFNIMDDHRVSPERELEFRTFATGEPSSRELKDKAVDYFKTEIRYSSTPAFLNPANGQNRVLIAKGEMGSGVHPELNLARALNLNGLRVVFRQNSRHPSGAFRELDGHDDDAYFRSWLDGKCQGDDGSKERFLDATLMMLNQDRKRRPYQPTWATFWEDFADFAGGGADRWRQVLGMRPEPEPAWIVVLRYKVGDADLYRPTQLDAEWHGYHFPSPAGRRVEEGGCIMDLGGAATHLVREYVHEQTDHFLQHWIGAGRLMGRAGMADALGLPEQRERHQELLLRVGGGERLWRR